MGGRIVCTGSGLRGNALWTLPFHLHSALTLTRGDSREDMPHRRHQPQSGLQS